MHKIQRRPFTNQENTLIAQSVKLIGEDWEIISRFLPGRTAKQVHDRYVNYLQDGLKKEPWTKEEDEILLKTLKSMGPKWTKMTPYLPGRSGNDIKNRWHKHLIKQHHNLDEINIDDLTSKTETISEVENKTEDESLKLASEDLFDIFSPSLFEKTNEIPELFDDLFNENWDLVFN